MVHFFLMLFLIGGTPAWPYDAALLPGDPLVIVNKKTNELAWIDGGEIQLRTKVATGKTAERTPEGLFTVTVKAAEPYYRKKDIPGGDPRNPLGSRWIGFDARGTDGRIYGLHGTNDPASIGKYVSDGCIRLPKEALEELYDRIKEGARVLIVNEAKSFEELAQESGAR